MNKIGIIGAMDEEIDGLKERMSGVQVTRRAEMDFYSGTLEGKQVIVVRSGIGKVNAGVCTQILADLFEAEAIFNTGIAGGLNPAVHVGDIVLSTDLVQHDMDAVGFGYPKGQIPRMETFSFEASKELRNLAREVCREVNPDIQVFEGRIVSGDQFISSKEVKERLVREFEGFATEMEGAAIAQAAYLNHLPFLVIRAISDNADDSAAVVYEEFEKQAILHSLRLVRGMLRRL